MIVDNGAREKVFCRINAEETGQRIAFITAPRSAGPMAMKLFLPVAVELAVNSMRDPGCLLQTFGIPGPFSSGIRARRAHALRVRPVGPGGELREPIGSCGDRGMGSETDLPQPRRRKRAVSTGVGSSLFFV